MRGAILLLLLPFLGQTLGADFIESVHAQGADIAKEMVVDGSQVVWSPFSVVNVLPLINGDESLKQGFKSSIGFFKALQSVEISRLTTAYVKDKSKLTELAEEYGVELLDFPEIKDVQKVLATKYKEKFGVEAPHGLLPESDSIENTTQLFLTSLMVKAHWQNPFKYAPKGRFYLNETHAIKARYMSNIGFYKYGVIEGVDAKILAIPFKNSTTTYFMVVLPNNASGLARVSQQFAEVQVGNILENLKNKRTQLTIPKITVESQLLLQPMNTVKIIQSGSLRFTYSGIDNRASKLRRTTTKFLRSRANKQDLRFFINRPFVYLIFNTQAGVLNYGEVLLPSESPNIRVSFKSDADKVVKMSQNARSLADSNTDLGNNLYQNLKNKLDTFALSPIILANLLASFSTVSNSQTQELFFSTLNSKSGMIELYNNIHYFNTSASNVTRITTTNADTNIEDKVKVLGTQVVVDANGTNENVKGYYEYNYELSLLATKSYVKQFYRNERDHNNVTFYEYQGRVKYIGLPFWDARAVLIYVSPTQSLLLFIPNERSGLHLIEEGLKEFAVAKLLCQMRDRFVRIRLPTISVESSSEILPSILEVFNTKEIKLDNGSVLDSITQNVHIKVDGLKGSNSKKAAKYLKYADKRRKPSTRLTLDRPFVFYLLDNIVGTLAVGRVHNVPEAVIIVEEDNYTNSPSTINSPPVVTTNVPATEESTNAPVPSNASIGDAETPKVN